MTQLIKRTYRITQVHDKQFKKTAKRNKISESELIRRYADAEAKFDIAKKTVSE